MERRALTTEEIEEALTELLGWSVKEGKLYKAYKFDSFAQALGWMVSAGIQADKLDHHPEWSNVYNRVQVYLVTHDLGNVISTFDVALAKQMDQLAM
ncbi:MAG: 4a-hydroxytetrahydrobiopterin dehydratase [Candidatus Promineifilaceae bacterium]|jgi:4a-hydroxytetrahydrobiopterin dehydratase